MRRVSLQGIAVLLVVLLCAAPAFAGSGKGKADRPDRLRISTENDNLGLPPASPGGGNSQNGWSRLFWRIYFELMS